VWAKKVFLWHTIVNGWVKKGFLAHTIVNGHTKKVYLGDAYIIEGAFLFA
jgi:hypothetical protein